MRSGRLVINGREEKVQPAQVSNIFRKMRGDDEKRSPTIEQSPKNLNICEDGRNIILDKNVVEIMDDKESAFRYGGLTLLFTSVIFHKYVFV